MFNLFNQKSNKPSDNQKYTFTLKDFGPYPLAINLKYAASLNDNYRLALWTGNYYQVTLMSINPGDDIGLEIHPEVDQLLLVEQGHGVTVMGNTKDNLTFRENISPNYAVMVPAGTWHNIINTGRAPLKLVSVYAPLQHPFGTVQATKKEAQERRGY